MTESSMIWFIRTRIDNLIRLGVSKTVAICLAMSSKGYYRLTKTKAVQIALNNNWLKSQGLVLIEAQWVKLHY